MVNPLNYKLLVCPWNQDIQLRIQKVTSALHTDLIVWVRDRQSEGRESDEHHEMDEDLDEIAGAGVLSQLKHEQTDDQRVWEESTVIALNLQKVYVNIPY